jgi:3',5'-cyclic AMP phosphodiesterase CpdA
MTEPLSFKTLDPSATEARFAVWNDTHENAETLERLMVLTAQHASDFHVWNGDITNDNYHEERMVQHYIGAGGQPFTQQTPLLFVRGNHDDRGPAARSLSRFQATPEGRSYYSWQQGPLAGVVLDTGEDKPDEHPVYAGLGDFTAFYREQATWLKSELKKPHLRRARFRVAFCHIPFWWQTRGADGGFANAIDDPRAEWHRLLVKAKFHAVISGHTHRHALFPPTANKPYAQLVGGGPKPESATLIRGVATAKELTLTMTDLEGRPLETWSSQG